MISVPWGWLSCLFIALCSSREDWHKHPVPLAFVFKGLWGWLKIIFLILGAFCPQGWKIPEWWFGVPQESKSESREVSFLIQGLKLWVPWAVLMVSCHAECHPAEPLCPVLLSSDMPGPSSWESLNCYRHKLLQCPFIFKSLFPIKFKRELCICFPSR